MATWSEGLVFLGENQYGFSRTKLGFPSISACRAIVYQTTNGLFGFHQATGAMPSKFERFGLKFARFVSDHSQGRGAGLNLYAAAKVGMGSSYSVGHKGALEHRDELKAFASGLKFTGPVRSYDLSAKWANTGVYVEMTVNSGTCDMFGNAWVDNHGPGFMAPLPGARLKDHLLSYPSKEEFISPNNVYVKVDTTGSQKLEPINIPMS